MSLWSLFWDLLKWRWRQGYIPPAHARFAPVPPRPDAIVSAGEPRHVRTDVSDLGWERRRRKAAEAADSREWTPLDALRDLVDELERGKVKLTNVYIVGADVRSDGTWALVQKCANVTRAETIALLTAAQQTEVRDWVS